MKQRIDYIDLAKGICILMVVLLHVLGDLSGTLVEVMDLFRMPLYFVLSGLFFKTYGGFYFFIKKKVNKLIIPFLFVFLFIILPFSLLLDKMNGVEITIESLLWKEKGRLNLGINGASWFLLCLFVVNLYFYVIFLLTKQNVKVITIVVIICGFLGYFLNINDLFLPLWFDSALTALPFFLFGYYLRNYSSLIYEKRAKVEFLYFLFSFIVLIGIHLYNRLDASGIIIYGDNIFDISITSLYIGGVSGTVCVLIASKYIGKVIYISYLGRYSIVVLLTHLLYLFCIRNILYQLSIEQDNLMINMIVFIIIILLELPTTSCCVKYLPFFFAQKDIWK